MKTDNDIEIMIDIVDYENNEDHAMGCAMAIGLLIVAAFLCALLASM